MGAVVRVAAPVGRRAGVLGALAYPVVVTGIAIARHEGLSVSVRDLASSPSGVLSGRVWRLLTSALVVSGPPLPQLLQMAAVVVVALVLAGPALFWRAALVGHVGATLVAYAAVGILWLVARADVDDVVQAPDYGISCVWVGVLGALVAVALRRSRRAAARLAAMAGVIGFVAAAGVSDDLAGWEHVIAFVLGCAVGYRGAAPRRAAAQRSSMAGVCSRHILQS
jgi:hypothetical protein